MQDRSGILPTADEAVAWANNLIARIAAARREATDPES